MEKDVEIMNFDGKNYAIIKEVEQNGVSYVGLTNIDDPEDVMIRKSKDKKLYIPLEDDAEFEIACMLIFKDSTK